MGAALLGCIIIDAMFAQAFVLALFASFASAFLRIEPHNCEVQLQTSAGRVCGRVRVAEEAYKYASFRGVPYGKPPLGERRFSELEPLDPWDYLLDATEDSPACPQKEIIYGRMTQQLRGQSEDCIYLNLHVPYSDLPMEPPSHATGVEKGLPIMVMVHGGGFQVGSGLTDVHGPEYLITKRVIVISLNYRINVFGFLFLGTQKVPGNQGLRDIIRALRWIQEHAPAFGGDPDNVTLMGQSCGASCVHLLSLSKAAEGLFHRIFLMSGHGIPNYFSSNPQYAKTITADFLTYLGVNSTDPDQIHDNLIKMPIEDIMLANSMIQYDYGLTSFVPVEEEVYSGVERVLDDNPLQLMAQGRGTQYPTLLGYTNSEVEFFKWLAYVWQMPQRIQKNPSLSLPLRIAYSFPNDITHLANRTAERCFHGNYNLENFVNCYSYLFFKYPMLKIGQWRSLGGAPAYLYKYTYESERSITKEALWSSYKGACHVEDLTFLYRTNSMLGDYVSLPPKSNDDSMKLWWITIATNFMKCNNPTCTEAETQWPPVNKDHLQYQEISQPMEYLMKDLDEEEADWLRYFDEVDVEVRNVSDELKIYMESETKRKDP